MGHLSVPSPQAVRRLLADLAPELAGSPIEIGAAMNARPEWCRASCLIGHDHVLKICWSDEAEEPLRRQTRLLEMLAGRDACLPTPIPLAVCDDPVALLYRRIPGLPLTYDGAGRMAEGERRVLANELAAALAALHSPSVLDASRVAAIRLDGPRPQASTDTLRERLVPRFDGELRAWLRACLSWVDDAIAEVSSTVMVHGDLHGYNLLLDDAGHLRGVLDFEESAVGPAEYDLRYLPRQSPTLDLLYEVIEAYQALTSRPIDTDVVMAWHVLTDLGDALWRTEIGVEVVAGPIERRTADLRELLARRSLPQQP